MDPNRYYEIQNYIDTNSATGQPPAGIAPPTSEEIAIFGSMMPPGRGGPSEAHGANNSAPRSAPAPSGGGNPGPMGGGSTPTGSAGLIGGGGSSGGPYEAHGANLPRDTARGGAANSGGTSAGGSAYGGGGNPYGGNTGASGGAGTEPASVRSIWSQALHDASEEAGGVGGPNYRMPFEQHPSGGVFANYQAVAQPGFGPNVPSRMPGRGATPQGGGGQHQMPDGSMMPNSAMPGGGGMPQQQRPMPQRGPQQQPQPIPQGNFSSPLAQYAGTPAIPGGPPPMPSPGQRPMQNSFGQGRPAPQGFPQPPTRDPRQRY